MRVIVTLKGEAGHYVVLNERPQFNEDQMLVGKLATGGEIEIPRENVLTVEIYNADADTALRFRLRQLEQN